MDSVKYENKNLTHCDRNARSAGYNEYHLQWVTKYRFRTLGKESHWKDCESAIRAAAERHGIKIVELGVMEDHVHVVAALPPTLCVSAAVGLLKGFSSHEMFDKHPNFRKRYWSGHFWGRGYFYRSVSNLTDDIVRRYVREDNTQRQRKLFGS